MREGTTYMHMAAFRSLNNTFLGRYGRIEFCLGRFFHTKYTEFPLRSGHGSLYSCAVSEKSETSALAGAT